MQNYKREKAVMKINTKQPKLNAVAVNKLIVGKHGKLPWSTNKSISQEELEQTILQSRVCVICTELYARGDISDEYWQADNLIGAEMPLQVMAGYHFWAKPLVKLMQRSELIYRIVKRPSIHWNRYAAYKKDITKKPDYIGAFVHNILAPICYMIGTIILAVKPKAAIESTK